MAEAKASMWHQTDQINMSVQMADISLDASRAALDGSSEALTLKINCNLKNIARGQCAVTIQPRADAPDDSGTAENAARGQLHIFVDRPLMTATVTVSARYFDQLTGFMSRASSRPMELVLTLEDALAVSLDGDLRIDSETIIAITGIVATIPVK
ncbi:hypothetical protein [Candidatus Puniceispirillum marinum]|nr:hypothetical protein [Candidatus Puniceispirillum marinum]